ncbi:unnamed protein product [marine sediment metagenome]|uniref:Uncharacterized protein n=1 Tax=marine sediment metagenome TaxID=412755 RepID=X0T1B1_9ZZZZ
MHQTWRELNRLLDQIIARYGGVIYDSRAHKSWDPGQAVCAECYGPDWSDSLEWQEANRQPDTEPVPEGVLDAGRRLANGECEWAEGGG